MDVGIGKDAYQQHQQSVQSLRRGQPPAIGLGLGSGSGQGQG